MMKRFTKPNDQMKLLKKINARYLCRYRHQFVFSYKFSANLPVLTDVFHFYSLLPKAGVDRKPQTGSGLREALIGHLTY